MKIDIVKICKRKTVTRDDGEKINKILFENWNKISHFDVDFNNVLVASVSFIDEAFGKLALQHTKENLQRKMKFENILDYDRALLNDILHSRFRQKAINEKKVQMN